MSRRVRLLTQRGSLGFLAKCIDPNVFRRRTDAKAHVWRSAETENAGTEILALRIGEELEVAIATYFHPKGMTLEQFEEIHRRLNAAGEDHNPHRLHHSCFGEDGSLMVYDIWDSPESFEAFGAVLMPILGEVGVDPGEPTVMPVHMLIQTAEG
jgi:hypothetical protein